jgi:hypothetical protein
MIQAEIRGFARMPAIQGVCQGSGMAMFDRIGMRICADLSHDVVAREMSNRWEQAQLIKCWIREIWNELGGDG